MDLMSLFRTAWRFKFVTLIVVLATAAGIVAVHSLVPPLYEGTSSYLLIQPPSPPTADEIAKDPRLAKVRGDNPYVRFGNPSIITDVLARRVNEDSTRKRLNVPDSVEYLAAPTSRFGISSPIVDITVDSPSTAQLMSTLDQLGAELGRQLTTLQAKDVDPPYMIKTRLIEYPEKAKQRQSAGLRAMLAVGVAGAIVLLVLLAMLAALERHRLERALSREQSDVGPASAAP